MDRYVELSGILEEAQTQRKHNKEEALLCYGCFIISTLKERDRASYATMMLTSLQEQTIDHSEMKFSSSTNHSKFKKAHEFRVLY